MMHWESWAAFWHMGGRAGYVWGSYGALALLVLAECASLAGRGRRAGGRRAAGAVPPLRAHQTPGCCAGA
ncbi:heme exporter protein CcmD, partial [Achromobacter xylosoxidans]|uniref:heme exporter protein CcmD n=1 Tax=Alcaligenes xylosoxydans xylosoxydans TaxID=85698 RepID=UPI00203AC76F